MGCRMDPHTGSYFSAAQHEIQIRISYIGNQPVAAAQAPGTTPGVRSPWLPSYLRSTSYLVQIHNALQARKECEQRSVLPAVRRMV